MVEYNNSYAGQGYAVQPGSVPPVDPITPGVPPVDPQKAQKKQKTSRILGMFKTARKKDSDKKSGVSCPKSIEVPDIPLS